MCQSWRMTPRSRVHQMRRSCRRKEPTTPSMALRCSVQAHPLFLLFCEKMKKRCKKDVNSDGSDGEIDAVFGGFMKKAESLMARMLKRCIFLRTGWERCIFLMSDPSDISSLYDIGEPQRFHIILFSSIFASFFHLLQFQAFPNEWLERDI